MRTLLATLAVTFVNFFTCYCQPLCACVVVDMETETYTIDKSGCVEKEPNDGWDYEEDYWTCQE